jgi:hypothetical protein
MEILAYLKWAWEIGPFLWKHISLKPLRRWWRNRRIAPHIRRHHHEFIHPMRELGFRMSADWMGEKDPAADAAGRIVTACRERMCELLKLREYELNCCIKVMGPRSNGEDMVSTWVRSEPRDSRTQLLGHKNARPVSKNTVWSCLLEKDDKTTRWHGFRTFACNNLAAAKDLFQCDREGWQRYYQSALVFTIRYPKNTQENEFLCVGFLVFDSPKINAFAGIPNIFKFTHNPDEYAVLLDKSAAFHLGAVFADMLGSILGPAYLSHAPSYEVTK